MSSPVPTDYLVDPRFRDHFRSLQQVFIYINDQCNLSCKQCIYKPHVTYHDDREIPLNQAMGLLRTMRELGAHKVTFLGGEPTLYGRRSENNLDELLSFASGAGYTHLRMDTNGLFPDSAYRTAGLAKLDELAFSLDGYDAQTNDRLRGLGTFRKITKQIQAAVARGMKVSITCCIHDQLVRELDGVTGVERVIKLGESLGVTTVNFHDLFKAGVPMDTWTGDFNTSVEDHIAMYDVVKPKIDAGDFNVHVRLPQCFVKKQEFAANPSYYGFCPVKLGERVMIHSDGVIRICSNLICSSFGTANYTSDTITWNVTASNELLKHELGQWTPCTNRSKNMTYGDYVPLCFSFKPDQSEPSWDALEWDSRSKVDLPFPKRRI